MTTLINDDPRLLKMFRSVREQTDPRRALEQIRRDCLEFTGATTCRIYQLDLASSSYTLHLPEDARSSQACDINLLAPAEQSMIRTVINKREARRVDRVVSQPLCRGNFPDAVSQMAVPIVRGTTCVGVIDLDSDRANHFTDRHEQFVEVAAVVALLLFEKEDVLNLLKVLPRPISLHQSYGEFLEELMLLIAEASQMPVVTLRELVDGDTLTCLKAYGLEGVVEDDLHLRPYQDFEHFSIAVSERRVVIERDMTKPSTLHLLRTIRQEDQQIQSICVVPVLVGDAVFGTLSFAAKCPHDYTEMEVGSLETIANAVGVAVSNYSVIQQVWTKRFEHAWQGAAAQTMEVSQAVRHEAKLYVDKANTRIATMKVALRGGVNRGDLAQLQDGVDFLAGCLKDINLSLEKIKTVTKPPEREYIEIDLHALWVEAFDLVRGRLDKERILAKVEGPHVWVKAYKEHLRFNFLNMISNSIDAFDGFKKQYRRITVTIEDDAKSRFVVMKYMDTGPGIDPSKLGPKPEGVAVLDPYQAVFEMNVTSKKEGSGFGLFLVRKCLAEHKGSIELANHRNGVIFELKLPRDKNNI